jgi:hypothetical protein
MKHPAPRYLINVKIPIETPSLSGIPFFPYEKSLGGSLMLEEVILEPTVREFLKIKSLRELNIKKLIKINEFHFFNVNVN